MIQIPSAGEYYTELGSSSLVGLSAGEFHRLAFPIPSELQSVLGTGYSDLTFTVIINARLPTRV